MSKLFDDKVRHDVIDCTAHEKVNQNQARCAAERVVEGPKERRGVSEREREGERGRKRRERERETKMERYKIGKTPVARLREYE